jgi:hypothetical protein
VLSFKKPIMFSVFFTYLIIISSASFSSIFPNTTLPASGTIISSEGLSLL